MPHLDRIGRAHTRITFTDENGRETDRGTPNGETHVAYHNRHVVCFNRWQIALRTNGYFTVTTRNRMNQVSNQYQLGYLVFQRQGRWYVQWMGMTLPIEGGGIILNRPDSGVTEINVVRPARSRRGVRTSLMSPNIGRPIPGQIVRRS